MSTSSSSSSDMTKTMVLTQLCPEIEQGIRNMNNNVSREQINNDISNIRLESMRNAYPDVQYSILLFRRYANDANNKIDNLSAKPYEVDQFVGKVGTIISPYINDEPPPIPDVIVPLQGLSAVTRNIFKFRSATALISFIAFVILCCTHEVFEFSLTQQDLGNCYFSAYADSTLYVSLVYYFFLYLDALVLFLVSLSVCIYYLLPIDPSDGLKYFPELCCSSNAGEETLNDAPETSRSSGIQVGATRRVKKAALCELCSSLITHSCGRVAGLIHAYCAENTMQLLLIADVVLLLLNLIFIVLARYGLYANFDLRFLLFSPYRSPTPIMSMFFSLDTFYHTFTHNSDVGMNCLSSSPIGKLEASVWLLTFALVLQCFQVRLSIKCYYDELKLQDSVDTNRSQRGDNGDVESRTGLMNANNDNSSFINPNGSNPSRIAMSERPNGNSNTTTSLSASSKSTELSKVTVTIAPPGTVSASPNKFRIDDEDEEETITLGGSISAPSTDL